MYTICNLSDDSEVTEEVEKVSVNEENGKEELLKDMEKEVTVELGAQSEEGKPLDEEYCESVKACWVHVVVPDSQWYCWNVLNWDKELSTYMISE